MRDPLPQARGRALLRVVGVGNPWREDDAAGLLAARALRAELPAGVEVIEQSGEPSSLLERFEGAERLWLLDAVSSGAAPGTLHRFDATAAELPSALFRTSTHHLGIAEAVELGRALGRLPQRLVVIGIEGARFEAGEGLSPAVADAVARAVALVGEEVRSCTRRP